MYAAGKRVIADLVRIDFYQHRVAKSLTGISRAVLLVLIIVIASPIPAQSQDNESSLQELEYRVNALYQDQQIRKALEVAYRALEQSESETGASLETAAWLNRVGRLNMELDAFTKAEPHFRRALEIRRELLPLLNMEVAVSHVNLAVCLRDAGRVREAIELMERSVSIVELLADPDSEYYLQMLHNLAVLYSDVGRFDEADALLEQSISLIDLEGASNREVAAHWKASLSMAKLLGDRGDYERAIQIAMRAAVAIRDTAGDESLEFASALHALGVMSLNLDRLDDAYQFIGRCIMIRNDLLDPQSLLLASTYNTFAALANRMGEEEVAIESYQHAIEVYQANGGNSVAEGQILMNLGQLHLDRGELKEAASHMEHGASLVANVMPSDHPALTSVHRKLAHLYVARGDFEQAVDQASLAVEGEERYLKLALAAGSERQKSLALLTVRSASYFEIELHTMLERDHPVYDQALRLAGEVVLQRKARSVDAARRVRGSSPEAAALLAELGDLRSTYASSLLKINDAIQDPQQASKKTLLLLRDEIERVERAIGNIGEVGLDDKEVTLESVIAQLPEDGVLVEFVRYTASDNIEQYLALTLSPGEHLQSFELGTAEDMDDLVLEFREAIAHSNGREITRIGCELGQVVIMPILHSYPDSDRLFISPDGLLNLLPFDVLPDSQGKTLVDSIDITYLTSGRNLLNNGTGERDSAGILILAAPDYGTQNATHTEETFAALPGTASEAQILSGLFPKAEVLTGEDASEQALRTRAAPRILHIATHGFFRRFDETSPTDGWSQTLVRSGLALAGANDGAPGSDDDGLLTALEVAALDLRGTDLVVLSACETGVGKVYDGDGVHGLRRAFEVAGVRAQLTSLWRVDDVATVLLMERFYQGVLGLTSEARVIGSERFDAGEPIPMHLALRESQLWLRGLQHKDVEDTIQSRGGALRGVGRATRIGDEISDHPFAAPRFWAAFVLVGIVD